MDYWLMSLPFALSLLPDFHSLYLRECVFFRNYRPERFNNNPRAIQEVNGGARVQVLSVGKW